MFNEALREIRFANRHHAGRTLAERLRGYAGRDIAKSLGAALPAFILPMGDPELQSALGGPRLERAIIFRRRTRTGV